MPRRHRDEKQIIKTKIQRLVPKLKSKNQSVLVDTIKSLGDFGRDSAYVADQIIPFVASDDQVVRECAVHALVGIGVKEKKIASLIRESFLGHKDPYVRARAYWILERIETK